MPNGRYAIQYRASSVSNFQLAVKVDVNFILKADPEQNATTRFIANFSGFKVEKSVIQPERVDEAWLDNLDNFLLRRRDNLYALAITGEDKSVIRRRLEADRLQREAELTAAIRREQEALEEARRNSLPGKMKALAVAPEK